LGSGRTNGRRVAEGGGYITGAVERGKGYINVGYQRYMDAGDLPRR